MVSNEVDVGYKVSVSKVMNAKGVANNNGDFCIYEVDTNNVIENNTQYLVTLDVNGVNKLYRELWTSGDTEDTTRNVPLSDYTYVMDEYAITGLTEDDAVVVRFEEVEVKTSDAFRAAVSKTAPKSEGGSGGGVLVVNGTWDDNVCTLDKTWQEIHDAVLFIVVSRSDGLHYHAPVSVLTIPPVAPGGDTKYLVTVSAVNDSPLVFETSSASGYPTYTDE